MNEFIRQFVEIEKKLLSKDRYLYFEALVTQFANKNEIKTGKEHGWLCWDMLDRREFTKHTTVQDHDLCHFDLPITLEKLKTLKALEDFFKTKQHWEILHQANCWETQYMQSIPFIALFLDEYFFSSFSNEPRNIWSSFHSPEKKEELNQIVKYLLVTLFEHITVPHLYACHSRHDLFYFDTKIAIEILKQINIALSYFNKLFINGLVYQSDLEPQPRYRDVYTFRSFNILLRSLKEYDEESAMKIMAFVVCDFNSFVSFLYTSLDKVNVIETLLRQEKLDLVKGWRPE